MQRQQTQAQEKPLTNLGAAQIAKVTYDTQDFQKKAFSKMKGFKGDEKTWADWRYKFRVGTPRSYRQTAAILDLTEDRYDQPISESDIKQVAARESWADMTTLNRQLHGDLISLMEECTAGFEIVRNTLAEVGLHVWRRLHHKCDPRNPMRNIQMLENLLAPMQVGCTDVVATLEKLEQELRVVRHRFGDNVENIWKSIHMVCIQKICPKTLRDDFAVQASSMNSPEKQKLTIEKFLQANVHGSGAAPMDVDALARTRGGKKGDKGAGKGGRTGRFDGNCDWCGEAAISRRTAGRRPQGSQKCPSRSEDLARSRRWRQRRRSQRQNGSSGEVH